MNPDTVVEPGTAGALVSRLEREPRLAVCGPRLRNPDGSDYPSARTLPSIPVAIGHGLLGLWWPTNRFTTRYRQLDADPAAPRLVDWVSGAAIWLRRRALDDVGGWDERYFMYLEDTDLCWRLRNSGWEVAYEPAGVVMHVQGVSASRRPYRMLLEHHRSAWRFARARFTGIRVVLLPFAAVYFSGRAVMAMSYHAWRASRSRAAG
jgi:N-acetylglucosaminyl-diphospho-decaprenol L-rhamnosyltransferase